MTKVSRTQKLQELGFLIRKYRIRLKMTQLELSKESGLDRNYIGMLERGERNPSFLTLTKISNGLNISLSQLFAPNEI